MKSILMILSFFAVSILTGCSSIISGTSQSLSVITPSVNQAQCKLTNNKGTWYVNQTPGSVVVHRSYKNLIVTCEKNGIKNTVSVKSKTKEVMLGNILIGGGIGAGVDMANGAANEYPSEINVPLKN